MIWTHSYGFSWRRICHSSYELFAFPARGSSPKAPVDTFLCEECGMEHIKWVGRCSGCKEWNTVKPFRVLAQKSGLSAMPVIDKRSGTRGWLPTTSTGTSAFIEMSNVNISGTSTRIKSWSCELDRVLGGGLVKGSVVLLAGEPGIGKSTLLLQLVTSLRKRETDIVVYVSGEETVEQIVSRAQRLQLPHGGVYLLCETDADLAGIDNSIIAL